jgi:hypothetical protein
MHTQYSERTNMLNKHPFMCRWPMPIRPTFPSPTPPSPPSAPPSAGTATPASAKTGCRQVTLAAHSKALKATRAAAVCPHHPITCTPPHGATCHPTPPLDSTPRTTTTTTHRSRGDRSIREHTWPSPSSHSRYTLHLLGRDSMRISMEVGLPPRPQGTRQRRVCQISTTLPAHRQRTNTEVECGGGDDHMFSWGWFGNWGVMGDIFWTFILI